MADLVMISSLPLNVRTNLLKNTRLLPFCNAQLAVKDSDMSEESVLKCSIDLLKNGKNTKTYINAFPKFNC